MNESKKDKKIYEEFCALNDSGITFIHKQSDNYPSRLKNISDAPVGLYMRGRCVDDDAITVAIIGARSCSEYGRQAAYEYLPHSKPCKGAFPERNRIISGLADVVIVVEARKRSGSLITVDQALEQGKDIMAVPGRISDPLSAGCNELIKLGAMIITCADDIRQIDAVRQWVEQRASLEKNNFKTEETQCWNDFEKDYLDNSDINLLASEKNMVYSTIIKESGLDIAVVSQRLFELQLQGAIKEVGKNSYVRCSI